MNDGLSDSMTEYRKYVFVGNVVPERANVHIQPPLTAHSDFGDMRISIVSSQISVVLESEEEIENVYTVRNAVKDALHEVLDVFSFTHGHSYSVEITSVTYPDNSHHVFGVSVGRLRNQLDDDERMDMFQHVLQIIATDGGRYLKRCLKDLRMSANDPSDTGLHCYRAIESIRKYFHAKFDIPDETKKDRAEGWEKMRSELDIKRDDIDEVKSYADEPRHGGVIEISDEERAHVFETTWRIIHLFVEYLHDNEEPEEIEIEGRDDNFGQE